MMNLFRHPFDDRRFLRFMYFKKILFVLFLFLFPPTSASSATTIFHETFENEASIISNGGTLFGDYTFIPGALDASGNGLYLASVDSLTYPSSGKVFKEEGSLSFWVKPDALNGGLLGLGTLGEPNSFGIFIATHPTWESKHVVFEIRDGGGHFYQAWSHKITMEPGEWFFITVAWNCGSAMRMRSCVNGICGADKVIDMLETLTLQETIEVGHTGHYPDASAGYDEMKFFGSFVSEAKILDFYRGQGSLTPLSQTFPSNGGTGNVHVSIPDDCDWTATSQKNWIEVTSSDSGTGPGTVKYSVDPNVELNDREGSILIAGKKFLVNQLAERSDTDGAEKATRYLSEVMEQCHGVSYHVYADADSACNHFVARGRISSSGDENNVPVMDETWVIDCQSGNTCIKAAFMAGDDNWGGWYFMNGVLEGDDVKPKPNWGEYPDAGIDLTGAKALSFWARGHDGGEKMISLR